MCELQLVLLDDIAEGAREVSPDGISWYTRGPLDLEGGSSKESEDSKTKPEAPGEPYPLDDGPVDCLCGSRFLVNPGVPGVTGVCMEPSEFIFPSMSPPLPEFTVMCNGLRGASPSVIVKVGKERKIYGQVSPLIR